MMFVFTVYHALYLEKLTCHELISKISDLFSLQKYQILEIYIQGPSSIHILLTDEVMLAFQSGEAAIGHQSLSYEPLHGKTKYSADPDQTAPRGAV